MGSGSIPRLSPSPSPNPSPSPSLSPDSSPFTLTLILTPPPTSILTLTRRIMRDDVLSYGGFDTVSAITLAAMEDLGWYLANYSAAQCMSWGCDD